MYFGGLIGSILALVAFFVAMGARRRSIDMKDRQRRTEEKLDGLADEVRWMREERRGEAPDDDGIFVPDQGGLARPAVIKAEMAPPPKRERLANDTQTGEPQADTPKSSVPPITPPPPLADVPRPPERESFEERLGTQWAVWAGGAALALGGLFLVRYTIEAGLLGPGVRVFLGAMFAAGLVAAGEWMRRGEFEIPIEALPKAHIPSILTAAGTIVAFGTIYAAHALYGFIGPTFAFLLLGAVGILTMLAAAIHGPALAGLGLAGAFLTPMLVSSNAPNFWSLTIYLGVVAASAYLLARTRGWLWLASSAVAGAVLWGLLMISEVSGAVTVENLSLVNAAAAHAILQLALAAGFMAYEPHLGTRDENAAPDWIAGGALSALTLLVCIFLGAVSFQYWGWMPVAVVAIAGLTATGWLTAPAAVALCLGGLVTLVALAMWPGLHIPPDRTLLAPYAAGVLRLPDNVSSFMTNAMLLTLAPAGVAAHRMWRGSLLPETTTGWYTLAATVPPLLALILSYLRITQFDISMPFALGGTALAGAFGIAADRFDKADQSYSVPAYNIAAGAFAAAAIAALAFALIVSTERGYLTVALALAALGTAYIASLRDIRLLRYAVTALGLLVLARVVWDPRIMGAGVGTTPVFNWLLVGYGVPAVAFALSARLLETREKNDLSVRISDALAVVFAGLLAFFEIRHLTNAGDVFHAGSGHVEAGLLTLVSIFFAYALAKLHLGKANSVFDTASSIFGASSIAFAAFGLLLGANPYFTNDPVGGRVVFSSLMTAYLLPGLAALFVARHARNIRPAWFIRAAGILAVVLIFSYVTLEVRHAFQGERMVHWLETSDAESWAYSAAWLLLGIVFLGYGLLRGSLEARIASAALIVLAALKVTLFDLAGIGGFWRAASFICLGAVLIGIGLVYQKIIFAKPHARAND